jgi:hypothetical protein
MPKLDHDQLSSNSDIWHKKAELLNAAYGQAITIMATFLRSNPAISPKTLDEHARLAAIVQKAKEAADAHRTG